MKILTLTGTRPELIRLSVILHKLDRILGEDHVLVYTNQNYDPNLSDIFLRDLRIRKPNYTFPRTYSAGEFIGQGFMEFEKVLDAERPDKVLVLGDTNSGLFVILAAKRGIPIYHMEAGNRCYDPMVPEETNRMIMDKVSLYNLPYTENSKENLIREGHSKNFVYKTGNPICEVLSYYEKEIETSTILEKLNLFKFTDEFGYVNERKYALLSFHRTENVDNPLRARNVVEAVNEIAEDMPVVYSFHPRTRDQFERAGIKFSEKVILMEPCGFFDFVTLEKHAELVLSDSGTVPEETMIFGVPAIILRNTTERQELLEAGSCILSSTRKQDILTAYRGIRELRQQWPALPDYHKDNVSDTVVRLLLGKDYKYEIKGHDAY